MGEAKYRELGIDYPLKDSPPMNKEHAAQARRVIHAGIRDRIRSGSSPDPSLVTIPDRSL